MDKGQGQGSSRVEKLIRRERVNRRIIRAETQTISWRRPGGRGATGARQAEDFPGYAAGVGKTYAMLEAAHQRRDEGVDVVIGYVETHGRAETDALVAGLVVIPRRQIGYQGTVLPGDGRGCYPGAPSTARPGG